MADLNKTNLEAPYVEVASGSEPVKKKSGLVIAIVGILIALAAAFLVYWFVPVVNNTVNMALMKPQDYFAKVHKDNMKTEAVQISEAYDKIISKLDLKSGYALEGSMTLDFNDDFGKENGIEELKSLGATYSYSMKDDKIGQKVGVTVNDASIATINALLDVKEENVFLQVPELTNSYIKTSMTDANVTQDENAEKAQEVLSDISSFLEDNPLTAAKLQDTLNNYTQIIFKGISNVELEKGVTGDSAGVTYEYNVLTATLNEKELAEKLIEVLEAVKEDEVVKETLIKAQVFTEDNYTSKIDDKIKYLQNTQTNNENNVIYKAYVDNKGIIKGMLVQINSQSEKSEEMSFITAVEGNNMGISYNADTTESLENIDISINQDGKKYSGRATVVQDNSTLMNIEFSDFEIVNEKNGYTNGVMKVTMPEEAEVTGFTATASSDGEEQKISYVFDGEDMDFGTMDITFKMKDAEDVVLPASSDTVYEIGDLESYMNEVDFEKFIDETGKKIGVENLQQRISNFFLGGSSSSSSSNTTSDDSYTATDNYYTDENTSPTVTEMPTTDDDDDTYNTDLSAMSIKFNGNVLSNTSPIGTGLNDFGVDIPEDSIIAANDYDFYESSAGTVSIMLENQTEADAKPADCMLIGISVYDVDGKLDISVNGITYGSTIADIEKAFNVKITNPDAYAIYIVDENDGWKEVDFGLEDGKVTQMDMYF